MTFDLRARQKPLKQQYRQEPESAVITITARGEQTDTPIACNIDLGRAIYQAEAHPGVGGPGAGACSGDLLLGALAACAQLTTQMVAEAMGIKTEKINVTVEGDLDLKGTLGIDPGVPVGFKAIRTTFAIVAPEATAEQLEALREKAEKYCVVLSTLRSAPPMETTWK
jgi:uncharacterized OsmC-like protein